MCEDYQLGLKKGTVKLVKHNEAWRQIAQKAIDDLYAVLGDRAIDIQHVGSTSIHHIYAKPVIDLAIGLKDKNEVLNEDILCGLEYHGFIHDPEHDNKGKIFFYKGRGDVVTHHVHAVDYNKSAWNSYVGFRDYLNSDYETAKKYQDIKLQAEQACGNDLDKYYHGKAELLKEIQSKVKAQQMQSNDIKAQLEKYLLDMGAAKVGFSNIRELPQKGRQSYSCAVTIIVPLSKEAVKSIEDAPTKKYFAEYERVNALLNILSKKGEEFLRSRGYESTALAATEVNIDKNLHTPFPHKTGAVLSNMGWIGKCALLVTKEFGSAHRITTILTNIEMHNSTLPKSKCGNCMECTQHCPGGAVKGINYERGMKRNDIYDAFQCERTAKQQALQLGISNTICGVCIACCPYTRRYINGE